MRTLVTKRLVLREAAPAEFDAMYQVLVSDIEGPEFKREHFTPEFQFDFYLSQQSLGQAFGRPCIYLQSNDE